MHLYEINTEIALLLRQLEPDPETGEIAATADDIIRQIDQLDMERLRVLGYIAKVVLDTRAEIAALKAEEERLAERRQRFERKEERLMQVLQRECAGEKTDLGVATVRYRNTARVDVQDTSRAVAWLLQNQHADCIRTKEPEIDKTAVRRLISDGQSIPGIALTVSQTCTLK